MHRHTNRQFSGWCVVGGIEPTLFALAVAAGIADAGLGLRSTADDLDLDFLPVTWEQFDVVLAVEALEPPSPSSLPWTTPACDPPSPRSAGMTCQAVEPSKRYPTTKS